MSQKIQEIQVQNPEILEVQLPRYGGGSGGGGESRGGGSEFSPEEVSLVFRLLQKTSESYFHKESQQSIPEDAIRDLHSEVFGAIRRTTGNKKRLMKALKSMADQADRKRVDRGSRLSADQMAVEIRKTIQDIKDCFFPTLPDE